jgi:hypothetical protein
MKRISVLTIACLMLMTASAAAQTPVGDAYGGAGSVGSGVASGTAGSNATGGGTNATAGSGTPVPGSGVAQASNEGSPQATNAEGVGTATAAAAKDLRGDSLPFTGFDLMLMLTGAGALLAAGMGMRRLSRRPI